MDKIRRFMFGRYGADQLGVCLVIIGATVTFVLSFVRTPYYKLISFVPYLLFIFRALSRNIAARKRENEAFLKIYNPVKSFFLKKYRQYQDKEHKYYKCKGCGHVLRVPTGKGKIEITCPYCSLKFKKNTGKPKTYQM